MFKLDRNIVVLDLETSHTNDMASVIQIGAVKMDQYGDWFKEDSFMVYIKPYTDQWSEESQEIHGLTKEFLAERGLDIKEALMKFNEWLGVQWLPKENKFYFATWGSGFDMLHLKHAYLITNLDFPYSYRCYDIASIVRFNLAFMGYNVSKGCHDCARLLGVDLSCYKAHDALHDAQVTASALKKMINILDKFYSLHPDIRKIC